MAAFAICPTCEGKGSHVNRAIDGNGITGEEMAELGPDFFEDYMSGVYDVRCEECGGNRVVTGCKRCDHVAAKGQDFCYDHAPDYVRAEIDDAYAYERERRAELLWRY